jgi:hypothetical protein
MTMLRIWRRGHAHSVLYGVSFLGFLVTVLLLAHSSQFTLKVRPIFFSVQTVHAGEPEVGSPSFERIDAHTHVFNASPQFYEMLQRQNMKVVTICVVDKHTMRFYRKETPQRALALEVFRKSGGRASWISTFDPQDWESPGFAERVNKHLDQTFADGAVGVKIYKSIGMELKSKSGKYLMPDDPVFDPIVDHIAGKGKTLYAHIAEPMAAWLPLNPNDPDSAFYGDKQNRFWYMYGHPDRPSKATILAARDHMLHKHPTLRVVGLHLGSMENDVDEIAKRFDMYPNFAVDTAARVEDLMLQPREKVRAFLIKYQDRVLYGTDQSLLPGPSNLEEDMKGWQETYRRDWAYFATAETVSYQNRTTQGLALPEPILRKIYHDNAVTWIPGIEASR